MQFLYASTMVQAIRYAFEGDTIVADEIKHVEPEIVADAVTPLSKL